MNDGVERARTWPFGGDNEQLDTASIPDVVIGKDILELLSSGMYVNPMTVYREYIQNAADAADSARELGLISETDVGVVDILVDSANRNVRIRDNGCGLGLSDFVRNMTALGASTKRGQSRRGFRGVGRLAGLAYAHELVFRSKVAGETPVSELKWDCRKLKAALRASEEASISEVIRSVAVLRRRAGLHESGSFFEVEMRGVVRVGNDQLLNPRAVSAYLSQVAPVPFAPAFPFGTKILEKLAPHVRLGELHIRVNGSRDPLYRPHGDSRVSNDEDSPEYSALDFIEIPAPDHGLAGIAWVLHHRYEGALADRHLVKGLRARVGDLQVGEQKLFESLFSEPRFNSWSVGEVHVIDRRIVPNGRRDDFEQGVHYSNLVNQLGPIVRDISRRCRTNSIRRKWVRQFETQERTVVESVRIIRQGSVSRVARERLVLDAEYRLREMLDIVQKVLSDEEGSARLERVEELGHELERVSEQSLIFASPLARFPKATRERYQEFFDLIYECSANRVAARALIDRILLRL